MPPPPDACEILGVRYASQLLAVHDEGDRAAVHRRRTVIGPQQRCEVHDFLIRLDRVSADDVADEARHIGFHSEPHLFIPHTEQYLGATVVRLRAP
jgi:hypothetical protein